MSTLVNTDDKQEIEWNNLNSNYMRQSELNYYLIMLVKDAR